MKRTRFWAAAMAGLCVACGVAGGQTIKMGTLAPEGTPWYDALQQMAAGWKAASNGRVTLRIYPGGVAGDDSDMLRKMRIGQLHAAALTASSLVDVTPDVTALVFPLQIRTDAELDYVIGQVGPGLERQLEQRGFKVLFWSSAGWVRFFAKAPVITPDDMRKRKLFFWGTEADYVQALKDAGFHPVPLAATDLLPSLQTGLVDAFPAPPTAALAFQWFALAPHMTDLKWQALPSMGIVTVKQWEKVPAELRPRLLEIARREAARVQGRLREMETGAIATMEKHGLSVHAVPSEVRPEWDAVVEKYARPRFVGHRFSQAIYERVQKALAEFRAREEGGAAPAP